MNLTAWIGVVATPGWVEVLKEEGKGRNQNGKEQKKWKPKEFGFKEIWFKKVSKAPLRAVYRLILFC